MRIPSAGVFDIEEAAAGARLHSSSIEIRKSKGEKKNAWVVFFSIEKYFFFLTCPPFSILANGSLYKKGERERKNPCPYQCDAC